MPRFYAEFAPSPSSWSGTVVFFVDEQTVFCSGMNKVDSLTGGAITRSVKKSQFKGGKAQRVEIIAPDGQENKIDRIILIGIGNPNKLSESDWVKMGGTLFEAVVAVKVREVFVCMENCDKNTFDNSTVVNLALGTGLASYSFDKYKTVEDMGACAGAKLEFLRATFYCADSVSVKSLWDDRASPVLAGTNFARDLIMEPANVLSTCEFVSRLLALREKGLDIQVLAQDEMLKLGMHALLGVSKGSVSPPYAVVMKWVGDKDSSAPPVALLGKGVVFDSGGISIKPSNKMGEMKGDMSGAAAVSGLMYALASREAKVNAVGVLGLVENMPGGNAQRPGDIVSSMSGQSIEIVNTDAEGRLVLADLLWYTKGTFKPSVMIDVATLTGAIVVALGSEYAGLFSNNDVLSKQLIASGEAIGELVWPMPMGCEYDKMIKSDIADMKNCGKRDASSITAAQFLKRFVGDKTAWAHLDIAGTATGKTSAINKSWARGWGVRLLDRFIRDYCER